MAKDLKLKVKNFQLAEAIQLDSVKKKLSKSKNIEDAKSTKSLKKSPKKTSSNSAKADLSEKEAEEAAQRPKVKARSKSIFAEDGVKEEISSDRVAEEAKALEDKAETIEVVAQTTVSEKINETTDHATAVETKEAPKKPETKDDWIEIDQSIVEEVVSFNELKSNKSSTDEPKAAKQKPAATSQQEDLKQDQHKHKKLLVQQTQAKSKKADKSAKKPKEEPKFNAQMKRGVINEQAPRYRSRPYKQKAKQSNIQQPDLPSSLSIQLPISVKDLAQKLKVKAADLISKLFAQGIPVTINQVLDDATMVELVGSEFNCEIKIDDTTEKTRNITTETVAEEINALDEGSLDSRPPIITFMGHVDHGKTSLVDYIRESNVVSRESGGITQHIGAFSCKTGIGTVTILDTPGHQAFMAMRGRGAEVTDIIVLVIAGDEGIKPQTLEAVEHAKQLNIPLVVALNKSDKAGFDPDKVYRQLSELDLLPEAWGGSVVTVNCSAVSGEGIPELLEMVALQAELLELKASPSSRARGVVIEAEMHKGLGSLATLLVQNGTLSRGDSFVVDRFYCKLKTMHDEHGKSIKTALPGTPVRVTGLSGLPDAGADFIVVSSEKEARSIADSRMQHFREEKHLSKSPMTLESLFADKDDTQKVCNIMIRTDVQGSVEALKVVLNEIKSDKVKLNIVLSGVGVITESDIEMANTSQSVLYGFHTSIDSKAETLAKTLGVDVRFHDVIYHVVEDVTNVMKSKLDKLVREDEVGTAIIKQLFKSSQVGVIAGCQIQTGLANRNSKVRVMRDGEELFRTSISSIRRVNDDVKEVKKGLECGITLATNKGIQEGDILEFYKETLIDQDL